MTIAELQLSRMRPLPVDRHTLAGLDRARRSRRRNIVALIAVWAVFWIYGLGSAWPAAGAGAALDRFLPIQVVAALAALVAFLGGRSLHRGGLMRRASAAPAALTAAGALVLVSALAFESSLSPIPTPKATASQPEPQSGVVVVSL